MNVEIINIGDELLIGQVTNTNASWMAEQLNLSGFNVLQFTIIRDDRDHILAALAEAEKRVPIVLISGGIGPTLDDITKQTLCEYFGTRLVFSEPAYHDIEEIFVRRGFQMTELNRRQAELPEICRQIPNKLGTARGMWFETERESGGKTVFVSMPGVPFEMKAMMSDYIIPALKTEFTTPFIQHKTILTQGVGESFLAEKIESWELALPPEIKLAYLPQPGIVRLRLTGRGPDQGSIANMIASAKDDLYRLIPEYIFGEDDETLEEVIGKALKSAGATLCTAESCTGGYIAHLITRIAGASDYFLGSVVSYSNDAKVRLLGIPEEVIVQNGAVSEEVVCLMALNSREKFGANYSLAVSGVAGPGGGTGEKPVGTTWIALASPKGVVARKLLFGDHRERNIRRSALQAMMMLFKELKVPSN